jgi:hypothetical protein
MPSDKQINYALILLGRSGYSTTYMNPQFKALGATMRERSGTVEGWLRRMNAFTISDLIDFLVAHSTIPPEPGPSWEIAQYDHALHIIQSMCVMMERSPSAYSNMEEEHIRDQLLVQLNGHFEGNATGETFNRRGRTDILLREKGLNVLIAECKFWRGPKGFRDAIDQLLGYVAWRDTKASMLVFSRDVVLTTVLSGIREIAESHPNYKRPVDWPRESGFRYIFHHPEDRNRELIFTVLAFLIPT